ncbi:MAG: TetR/AcrR family transcriptional regulator [Actinobacteria bacterium]|nr:TetR/AcrR family transcriptional regulator [Actinomycetota bacterium]
MGLRERKRAEMRQRIVAVAYRLFDERGYDETTVEDIAEAAYVSPRTFYRQFTSKDRTLPEIALPVLDRVVAALGPDASVPELAARLAVEMEHALDHPHAQVLVRLLREDPRLVEHAPSWRHLWACRMQAGFAASREGRTHPDDRLRATTAVTVVGLAIEEWLRGSASTITDLVDESLRYLGAQHAGPPADGRSAD